MSAEEAKKPFLSKMDDLKQKLVQLLIEQIKNSTSIFQKPWTDNPLLSKCPYNGATGKAYKGANTFILMVDQMVNHRTSAQYLTLLQGNKCGGRLRKGSKGIALIKWVEKEEKDDGQPKPLPADENARKQMIPIPFYVYSRDDFDGLQPEPAPREIPTHERNELCEQVFANSGVPTIHGGNEAYYSRMTDTIHMPVPEQFNDYGCYLAVRLHETGHSTGHPRRLNRQFGEKFGDENYQKEELVAEMFSIMASMRLNVPRDFTQQALYIKSWVKGFEDQPNELIRAAAMAEQICTHLKVPELVYEAQPEVEPEPRKESTSPQRRQKNYSKGRSYPKRQEQAIAV